MGTGDFDEMRGALGNIRASPRAGARIDAPLKRKQGAEAEAALEQLKTDLTVELENAQGSIAAWKQEVIHGDKMKIKFSERKVYKIEQLKGRQAAYADFINQGKRTQKFNKYVPLQPASKRARRHCGAQSHWWSAKTLVERKPWWSAKTLVERRPWWSTSFVSPADPGRARPLCRPQTLGVLSACSTPR